MSVVVYRDVRMSVVVWRDVRKCSERCPEMSGEISKMSG
jgi:hypothetical protein